MSTVQRRLILELGPDAGSLTDYSCDFSEFVIEDTRTTVQKAPSFGSPTIEQRAAAKASSVRMTFLAVPHGSSGLWWELHRAANTTTGELYFEVTYDDDTVSASNPKFTGYIVVTALQIGAAAYSARKQSAVVPARDVSAPITA